MRIPSTLFPLILSSVLLCAQTPQPSSGAVQYRLPEVSAPAQCPVRFSVERHSQGAIADAGSSSEWSRRYGNHTFAQQWKIIMGEPGFDQLTAQQQQAKMDQLSALYRASPEHSAQSLGVTLGNAAKRIVSADVVVHGYSGGTHILPAAVRPEEITESFHLAAKEGFPLADSPIRTTRIAMVQWLELTRIEYADGTSWQPSSDSRCTASPSLFVLVGAAAR